MNTATATPDLAAIKQRQQATWASGDFAVVGTTLQIVGETLAEAADVRADERVIDVAAGNGNATLAAARRFAHVTSTDYVPALLDKGRERARAEVLPVTFQVADAEALPFADASFDVVCAFQMLEHLPYEAALGAFGEMVRVARCHVVISLPDARTAWRFAFHVPRVGTVEKLVLKPTLGLKPHVFDGEHHWEVNKRETPLARVVADFSARCPLVRTYRVAELPYHRFFVFRRA